MQRSHRAWRSAGAAAMIVGLVLAGCSSSKSSKQAGSSATPTSAAAGATATSTSVTSSSTTAGGSASKTVWLCKPGATPNPCESSLATTIVNADGSEVAAPPPKANPTPTIDCFYVYPTVSTQQTAVANLHIDPAETAVATAQASRFSTDCNVYAPMYRQSTLVGIFGGGKGPKDRSLGFADVEAAWKDYLANDNHGHGVVLIGHSQGSFELTSLIKKDIDPVPAVRKLLVSAVLLGGNVMVPKGKDVGGSFTNVPACRSTTQTGCVVAYSSFLDPPPAGSLFGKGNATQQVLCVNPADPAGNTTAALDPFYPVGAALLGGGATKPTKVQSPWVEYPDLETGHCVTSGDFTWLQITDVRGAGDTRPALKQTLGPTWGLHLVDVNVAYGNLVKLVASQAAAWK